MIRPLLLLAALLSATQASALTCAPPDPLRSFREAQAAPESYVVLHGRLSFDPAAMPNGRTPPRGGSGFPPVMARFDGFALGLVGFTRPVRARVALEPTCLGPFCGSIGPEDHWLLFARVAGPGSYRVEIDPCASWAFDRVPEAALDALAGCLRGEACGA